MARDDLAFGAGDDGRGKAEALDAVLIETLDTRFKEEEALAAKELIDNQDASRSVELVKSAKGKRLSMEEMQELLLLTIRSIR